MLNISRAIVVVDDDQDDLDILTEVFSSIGVGNVVRFFSDVPSVLEFLRETREPPFLILCDINMPHLSGFDLRQALVNDPELRRKSVPFVFYSTAAPANQVDKAFGLSVQGFFLKGSKIEEIERKMRIILDYWSESETPRRV